MGCCCAKENEDQDISERSRLLQNNDLNQKSCFVDSSSNQNTLIGMNSTNGQNYQRNPTTNGVTNNLDYNTLNTNGNQTNKTIIGNNFNSNYSESNQMFEKIMSEVIHVSAFEQRGNLNNDISSHPVQDMPLKIKGLLEPTKQHLTLPEGVPAPVTVLSAQPPFNSDIHLINCVALDAQRCIDSFCLNVPENVAFDFNPVAIMFSIYKTVHPPTGIENAIFCNFINPKDRNLITSSANILQVYRLNADENKSKKLKFECIETFTLFGNINAMAFCRYGSMSKDALILAFDDAKISIVEYDSFIGDLTTLSIHYFENEMEEEGIFFNIYHPILKVDPNMRCAVMLIYGCKLVVIPFYEDHSTHTNINQSGMENRTTEGLFVKLDPDFNYEQKFNVTLQQEMLNSNSKKMPTTSSNSLSSYSIDLRKLDNWLEMRIIDIEFLYGYYEPTLFILSESNRTWVGRYAVKKDTCNSIALSLNLHQKTHPLIWPVDKLPSDCLKSVAVPLPIGGVLLFAVNSLIYINQSIPSYAVSLNSIAKTISSYPFKNMEKTKITLDCSHCVFVAPDRLILSLKGGEIYIVTLVTDSESLRTIRSFNIEKGPGSVIASCLTKCFENYLFFGSRLGNSILLKYSVKNVATNTKALGQISSLMSKSKEMEKSKLDSIEVSNIEELDYDVMALYEKSTEIRNQSSKENCESEASSENDELEKILEKNEEKQNSSANVISYNFEICDMLLNIAPCGHSIIGESVGDFTEFNSETFQYHIDLITSSGYSKHGAISVLQRSIRPEIIASFQIPEIIDMWSVFSDSDLSSSTSPTYLFLSKTDSTMILQMANEITELDRESTSFCTKFPTLYCTNLSNNKYILQITINSCLLFSDCLSEFGARLIFTYDLLPKLDSKIKHVLTCDQFIVILTQKGTLLFLKFNEKDQTIEIFNNNEMSSVNNVSCFTLYRDENNFILQQNYYKNEFENKNTNKGTSSNSNLNSAKNYFEENKAKNNQNNEEMTIDDEDELLYGSCITEISFNNIINSESSKTTLNLFSNENESIKETEMETENVQMNPPIIGTHQPDTNKMLMLWLITVSFDGTLNIFNIDGEKISLTFMSQKFNTAPKTLFLTNYSMTNNSAVPLVVPNTPARSSLIDSHQSYVNEILMIGTTWNEKSRPFLIAKIDEDLIIYEGFVGYISNQTNGSTTSQLNFKRISHDAIIRDKKKRKNQSRKNISDFGAMSSVLVNDNEFTSRTHLTPMFRSFNNIAGFNGFFITGSHPYIVFLCPRTGVTLHPFWIDGPINSFVPLNNVLITQTGFIYLNKNFDIRICTLPVEDFNGKLQIYYDSPWILRKVQLRQTVHFISYHEESKTYAVVTSVSETTNKLMQLGGEDKELETFEKDDNFILPNKSIFTIQLYASNVWEPLPLGKYSLTDCEHVSCLKLVSLPYEGHSSGYRTYLAVATVNCYNEDVNSRGKVIVFDVIETVPEPDKPLTNTKMKLILEKEQKGPVTCLESVNGYLLGGVGQKIFIWEFKNNELIGKAFIDTQFFIHKMIKLKNFVLIADLHRSISLIKFQQEYTKLSFIAKDKHIIDTYACEYLVDNTNLAFISSDSEKNVSIYMYQMESHDNQGGSWLVRKSEFNIGSHINSFFRIKCKVNDPSLDKRSGLADKRQVTYCTTLDGSIGYILPISEKTFRRLFILQNAIFVMKPHYAGLNPKSFRIWKGKKKELINTQKSILDGDLLFEYFNLSFSDRNDIAKKIKTNTDQLLDDLAEVFQFTAHF